MCILIYKPKGVPMPSDNVFLNCWLNNGDGAGMAWSTGTSTHLKKGFMTWDHFLLFLEQRREEFQDYAVVIHFRLATHGAVNPQNCHPFVISDSIRDLQRTRYTGTDMILAHNGIISGQDYSKKTFHDLSDTMLFTKKLHVMGFDAPEIKLILDTGKFVILYPNKANYYGTFILDGGIYYSNTSYKFDYLTATYKSYKKGYYDTEGFDDEYEVSQCDMQKECVRTGVCQHYKTQIEDEMIYGDPKFCPISKDWKVLDYNDYDKSNDIYYDTYGCY